MPKTGKETDVNCQVVTIAHPVRGYRKRELRINIDAPVTCKKWETRTKSGTTSELMEKFQILPLPSPATEEDTDWEK
jgi:hypothetical protein